MKRIILFSSTAVLVLLATIIGTNLGCNDPNTILDAESNSASILDKIAARVVPDLVITAFTTNVANTTTSCGGTLPNVSCFGGQRNFTATVTIVNTGPGLVPPGSLQIRWNDLTLSNSQTQTITHAGIPAGGSLTASRPFFMGPCIDCLPPPTFYTHSFNADVDPNNLIPEANEGNNTSPTFTACDGC